MARTRLPLGLNRYAGNRFDELHGLGCQCITSSYIPDLFGLGRNGSLAYAAHAMGIMALPDVETDLTNRGRRLQDMAAHWYAEETGAKVKPVHAWVKDPELAFYASPDMIELGRQPLPGEVKIVANQVFDEQWQAGPPQKVLLQHQGQLALTGADAGPVVAVRISDFVFDIKYWMIERHQETQDIIADQVENFLEMMESGTLPPPDFACQKDQDALIRLATVEEGKTVDLPDELLFHVKRYQRAGVLGKAADKRKKEAKAHLVHALKGAEMGVFKDGQTIKLNKIDYAEQEREAYSVTRLNVSEKKAPKPAGPSNPSDGVADAMEWEHTMSFGESVGESQNGV